MKNKSILLFIIGFCFVLGTWLLVISLSGCAKGVKTITVPTLTPAPTPTVTASSTGTPTRSATPSISIIPTPSPTIISLPTPYWRLITNMGTTETFRTVQFLSSQEGWIAGDNGILLHTTNEGSSWQKSNLGMSNNIYTIFFYDINYGWFASGYLSQDIGETTNMGNNWSFQGCGVNPYGIFFSSSLEGWAVGVGNGKGLISNTENGGLTWQPRYSSDPTEEDFTSVCFSSHNEGWVVGGYGSIVCSTDEGITWRINHYNSNDIYQDVCFAGTEEGWVVGNGGLIIYTNDHGISWQNQIHPNSSTNLTGVFFISSSEGWVTGSSGVILHTLDKGQSWSNEHSGGQNLLGISMINSELGWVVGEGGTVLKYSK